MEERKREKKNLQDRAELRFRLSHKTAERGRDGSTNELARVSDNTQRERERKLETGARGVWNGVAEDGEPEQSSLSETNVGSFPKQFRDVVTVSTLSINHRFLSAR